MVKPIRIGKNNISSQIYPCMSSAKPLAAVLFPDERVVVFLQMLCYKGAPREFMGLAGAVHKQLGEEHKLA
jgi:hypothetical protein